MLRPGVANGSERRGLLCRSNRCRGGTDLLTRSRRAGGLLQACSRLMLAYRRVCVGICPAAAPWPDRAALKGRWGIIGVAEKVIRAIQPSLTRLAASGALVVQDRQLPTDESSCRRCWSATALASTPCCPVTICTRFGRSSFPGRCGQSWPSGTEEVSICALGDKILM